MSDSPRPDTIAAEQHKDRYKLVLLFIALIWAAMIVNNVLSPRVFANDVSDILSAESEKGVSWYARQIFFCIFVFTSMAMIKFTSISGRPRGFGKLKLGILIFFGAPIFLSSWLGEVPSFSPYLFCLPLALGVIWRLGASDYRAWIKSCRLVILAFVYASIAAIVLNPQWAIDFAYDQSWFHLPVRLYGVASLPNQLAPLVSLYFPLSILENRNDRSLKNKFFAIFNSLLCLAVIFLTQSKTVWVLLVFGSFCSLFYPFIARHWKKIFILGVGLLVGIYVCTDVYSWILLKISDGDISLTGRTFVWLYALAHWWDNPVFGYGNALLRGEDRETFASLFNWTPAQAHNQWIHTLGQCGLVGFVGLAIYATCLIRMALHLSKPTNNMSVYLVIIFIARTLTETPLSATLGTENFLLHIMMFGCLYLGTKYYSDLGQLPMSRVRKA